MVGVGVYAWQYSTIHYDILKKNFFYKSNSHPEGTGGG